MLNQSLTAKRIFLNACLLIVAMLVVAAGAFARTQDPAERQKAIDLYESNNLSAALPLLEKIATANPDDAVILSRLGFALYANQLSSIAMCRRASSPQRARPLNASPLEARSIWRRSSAILVSTSSGREPVRRNVTNKALFRGWMCGRFRL